MSETGVYLKLARAFEIFAECRDDGPGVAADSYCLYAGPDPADVSAEHIAELKDLGWDPDGDTFSYTF